jgi:hypothetical protein
MIPKSGHRFSGQIMRKTRSMIPTRRAALALSGHRFSGVTNAVRVCAEIMRKTSRMIPKGGHRFSDKIMRKTKEA